jgi:hypothetical protein
LPTLGIMSVKIFDKNNIQDFKYESYHNGLWAEHYIKPMVINGTKIFIENADCEMQLLTIGSELLPIQIANTKALKNAYITSPTAQYFDLALEEIEMEISDKDFRKMIAPYFLSFFKQISKWFQFEKTIFVNNWLLSTNLYPSLESELIPQCVEILVKRFPEAAIVFRSVNDATNTSLLDTLLQNGFHSVISRQVYMMFPEKGEYKKKRMLKSDQKLWQKTIGYTWHKVDNLEDSQKQRLKELYQFLYREKYSSLNPSYNEAFIEACLRSGLMEFYILKKDEIIDGVTAFFKRNGEITTPFIGYDHTVNKDAGLYRFLNLRLMDETILNKLILNMSSGAAQFKRMRGGEPHLEYNMVYYKHLSYGRRLPWKFFQILSTRLVIPAMKKYGL